MTYEIWKTEITSSTEIMIEIENLMDWLKKRVDTTEYRISGLEDRPKEFQNTT